MLQEVFQWQLYAKIMHSPAGFGDISQRKLHSDIADNEKFYHKKETSNLYIGHTNTMWPRIKDNSYLPSC